VLAWAGAARGDEAGGAVEKKALRVCGDPNNLPFSNSAGEGFENKIAELLARDLGWELEYTWFPQRIGFIRNTLKKKDPVSERFACDLVMGVPAGFDLADTTTPYYRSTYALVFASGRGLDGVHRPDDVLALDPVVLRSLKFGLFGRTPPTEWLLQHGLIGQSVPYQLQTGDPDQYPGEVIEKDLASGKIDVALVWGPIAGWFATKRAKVPMTVVAFPPDARLRLDFSVAMGVRGRRGPARGASRERRRRGRLPAERRRRRVVDPGRAAAPRARERADGPAGVTSGSATLSRVPSSHPPRSGGGPGRGAWTPCDRRELDPKATRPTTDGRGPGGPP
jgi:quinoprotein dehydrogenase-associated probable ABC transporter substrate-binding protein